MKSFLKKVISMPCPSVDVTNSLILIIFEVNWAGLLNFSNKRMYMRYTTRTVYQCHHFLELANSKGHLYKYIRNIKKKSIKSETMHKGKNINAQFVKPNKQIFTLYTSMIHLEKLTCQCVVRIARMLSLLTSCILS